MTVDELNDLPRKHTLNANLMPTEEFASWIATRKEAGSSINIETAELTGWQCVDGDPYGIHSWSSGEASAHSLHYFVRDAESRGWIWQNDLPEYKRATVQVRIDEHNRKAKKIDGERQAAGRLIDTETCEMTWWWANYFDPYGIELAPPGSSDLLGFVRNKGSWVCFDDLPNEKQEALNRRAEREELARKHVIDDLFWALRQRRGLDAIAAAEKIYGRQIVKNVLDCDYRFAAIGGLMIKHGYLTMEHVAELLLRDEIPF
jgi:hypothetical protein